MEVDDKLVEHIAELAKLQFENKAKEEIKSDLSRMLNFVSKLNELNTDGVEPLIFMSSEKNVLRADVLDQSISKEEALSNAPKRDNDYFKLAKVLSK